MLQSQLGILHLPLVGAVLELPAEFGTLSETSGSQRMSFRDETATRVDHNFTTVCEISSVDSFMSLALLSQSDSFISAKLVWREAVMQLTNLDFVGDVFVVDTSFLVDALSALFGHVSSDKVNT